MHLVVFPHSLADFQGHLVVFPHSLAEFQETIALKREGRGTDAILSWNSARECDTTTKYVFYAGKPRDGRETSRDRRTRMHIWPTLFKIGEKIKWRLPRKIHKY